MSTPQKITVETEVNIPVEKAWKIWSTPSDIMKWNNASPDWHAPKSENDLRVGGKFSCRMEAKDGSFGFDFAGTYTVVKNGEQISYTMDDGRKVDVLFSSSGGKTKITEIFEAETQNPVEMQRGGWQAILDNYKKYAENV